MPPPPPSLVVQLARDLHSDLYPHFPRLFLAVVRVCGCAEPSLIRVRGCGRMALCSACFPECPGQLPCCRPPSSAPSLRWPTSSSCCGDRCSKISTMCLGRNERLFNLSPLYSDLFLAACTQSICCSRRSHTCSSLQQKALASSSARCRYRYRSGCLGLAVWAWLCQHGLAVWVWLSLTCV